MGIVEDLYGPRTVADSEATSSGLLVVEDDQPIADCLQRELLGVGLVADVVQSGLDALRCAHARSFALAMVDADVSSDPDGTETTNWLRRVYGVPVLLFTTRGESQRRARLRTVEPIVGLSREVRAGELGTFVHTLLRNSTGEASGSATAIPGPTQADPGGGAIGGGLVPPGFAELSGREWQILGDLIETPSHHAVAQKRGRSPHTIHNHLKSVFRKLHVHSIAELFSLMLRLRAQDARFDRWIGAPVIVRAPRAAT